MCKARKNTQRKRKLNKRVVKRFDRVLNVVDYNSLDEEDKYRYVSIAKHRNNIARRCK